ncbi:DNA gyrase inhibitor SbmC [Serratia proteamaculans]|jgi:DNA gyrase inhibitor|uniref:DNA gyrase inhibitor n=1 Tax=Serratia proteamaculans TaxID=28151 RepID=A0ABS0TZV9_SERPR|nr:DNA gyrase inhibitor SbmC [Serratia proteamaculans]MBI6183908.1 DNA gyrase inhibitor SbmC [Serratia proteamaculans]CAI0714964.1 DNA gyrase inhibitor [Serratia proteamaculans]CAI0745815.1 DNA gyrase inhibitor [Serratia proteamaculans]CAI0746442.1 DNA gyrase inhibitor [Serratia proteamaculans]CAI1594362.1 DNA gyrase inhibitor [Serratia proteamaculans]
MAIRIEDKAAETVVGLRVVGPYPQTIPQGCQRLMAWQQQHKVPLGKWLVLYWDDPSEVAPERLRADVVFTVADDFVLPTSASEGVTLQTLPAGQYAIYNVRVSDGDFERVWGDFYQRELPASGYQPVEGVCYEHYLNDCEADGYFDLDIYQTVKKG